jgi:protein O-GlcNAc transferase
MESWLLIHIFVISVSASEFLKSSSIDKETQCWGYETDCDRQKSLSNRIQCSRPEDKDKFFDEADFGYVAKKINSMEEMCEKSSSKDGGFLKCSEQLQFCQAKDMWIDFRDMENRRNEQLRYSSDVLKRGQIGARCKLHSHILKKQMIHMGTLQSWSGELLNFVAFNSSNEIIPCDITIDRPTFIMKLDATVNMYHHYCDFFNLFVSQHINGSISDHSDDISDEKEKLYDTFNRDIHILIWENQPYRSAFSSVFKAFTDHPLWNLNTFAGKRVCFKNAVLPLLPRMLYGLFYNTPLTPNDCSGSGLFKAFSDFIPSRMGISEPVQTDSKKIKVTILARLTRTRKILNLGTLHKALIDHGGFDVTIAQFSHTYPYEQQMEIIRNTDILVGIHGAGLTHMLFLPDWAVVFELYDCDDPSCYKDLARLRGIKHISWTNMEKLHAEAKVWSENEPHIASAKFTNYAFDEDEFVRKLDEAALHVKSHLQFQIRDVHQTNIINQSDSSNHDEL